MRTKDFFRFSTSMVDRTRIGRSALFRLLGATEQNHLIELSRMRGKTFKTRVTKLEKRFQTPTPKKTYFYKLTFFFPG